MFDGNDGRVSCTSTASTTEAAPSSATTAAARRSESATRHAKRAWIHLTADESLIGAPDLFLGIGES
jgi:hypothetical protein